MVIFTVCIINKVNTHKQNDYRLFYKNYTIFILNSFLKSPLKQILLNIYYTIIVGNIVKAFCTPNVASVRY